MPQDRFTDDCVPEHESEAGMRRARQSEALRDAWLAYWRDPIETHIKELTLIAQDMPDHDDRDGDFDVMMEAIGKLRALWPASTPATGQLNS